MCIPCGVALGYVYGGLVGGHLNWRYAFWIEAIMMLPFAVLGFVMRPLQLKGFAPAGSKKALIAVETADSEGQGCELSVTEEFRKKNSESSRSKDITKPNTVKDILRDAKTILSDKVYVVNVIGYTAYNFVIGAYSYWGPKAGYNIYHMINADITFGGMTCICGVFGTLAGGLVLDRMTSTISNAFKGPMNFVCLHCVKPSLRPLSIAMSTVSIHIFGDVPSSPLVGVLQRDDTEVLDEPLYANFLRVTGVDRPYREEVLSKMESDGNKVVREIIFGPGEKKYRFCKHMSKQLVPGLTEELMKKGKHFILIRNPLEILPSFDKVVPPSFLELGLAEMVSIYVQLCEVGKPPAIIDAADLKSDPEGALRGLCEDLGILFQSSMLKWEAGPKPVDGMWAPWWYDSVRKSTCFSPPRKYPLPLPSSLYDLLEQSLPFYNMLRRHVKRTSSKSPLTRPSLPVPANEKLLAWVGDEIVPRESAKVSVFDSVVQGGDAVWEGLRVYSGKIFKLEEHLDRLFDSAKALAFSNVPTREEVKDSIFRTLICNAMFDNAHIRLTLTRGKKVTSGMSPAFNLYGCTLIVLAEWKPPVYDNTRGVTLVTATTRRNSPNNLDSKIHHNNLLNNILAKIEGNNAKADDAIMLDKDGYVSETNATNIFLVKRGRVVTPHANYCLPGVTRATVMDLVVKEQLDLQERHISLSEFHTADEVWTTGTMGELSPVIKIDGRVVGDGRVGPVTRRLQNAYKKLTEESGVPIPTYQKS